MITVFEGAGVCGPPGGRPEGLMVEAVDGGVVISFRDYESSSWGEWIMEVDEAEHFRAYMSTVCEQARQQLADKQNSEQE